MLKAPNKFIPAGLFRRICQLALLLTPLLLILGCGAGDDQPDSGRSTPSTSRTFLGERDSAATPQASPTERPTSQSGPTTTSSTTGLAPPRPETMEPSDDSSGTVSRLGGDGGRDGGKTKGEFASVSAGEGHTCGVRTDGSVACWGLRGCRQNSLVQSTKALFHVRTWLG